ncbi:cytochrome P450 [Massilia niastensis]|uniref:cytochrome P450 n=1 Tax=Massilia niastensis TaxID=544911 RepID=UPI00036354BE|nr:cytochrome P450 [Massilia niastensis]
MGADGLQPAFRDEHASLAPFDDAFLDDPYPTYRILREAGPVLWRDDVFDGAWLLTRHADVELALRDPRFSSQRTGGWIKRIPGRATAFRGERAQAGLEAFQRLFGSAMVFLDGPDHQRVRKAMAAGFHPSLIRALRPQVERLAEELLDALDGRAGFDFIGAVARPLPSRVIGLLLGIEREDEARFMAWSDELAAFIGALQPSAEQLRTAQRSLLQMVRYFDALLPARRRAPGEDLISRLVQAEAAGELRPDGELLAQCAMLLFAGHETTRNLLGNGLHTLLEHPAQWERLRANPEAMPLAVRELLRYDSPVQYTGRRVASGFTLHGETLRRGDLVLALIGSANRDPARFSDPDAFDIDRREGSHMSFGSGPHVCIGAGLSLLEADVVLRAVMQRWPALARSGPASRWNRNAGLRGLARLQVAAS